MNIQTIIEELEKIAAKGEDRWDLYDTDSLANTLPLILKYLKATKQLTAENESLNKALEEAREKALEEAALICGKLTDEWWTKYKEGNTEWRAHPYAEGASDQTETAALRIRALKQREGVKG